MKHRYKWLHILAALVVLAAPAVGITAYLIWNGRILLNNPFGTRYPVRDVDVSHYQGEIDWVVPGQRDVDFAHIKATEGSFHIDERFSQGWLGMALSGLTMGAYHFFSFDNSGKDQLAHFAQCLPPGDGMLPPAVGAEFCGDKAANPPNLAGVGQELTVLLEGLERQYGMVPIIYATEEPWNLYIRGRFDQYPLWVCSVKTKPCTDGKPWLLWQYVNRQRLAGYKREETFIDMNVYCGSREQRETRYGNRNKSQGGATILHGANNRRKNRTKAGKKQVSDVSVLITMLVLTAGMAVFMTRDRGAGTMTAGMNCYETAVDNKIYTPYSQRDMRWSSNPLGIFKDTMESSGCLANYITVSLTAWGIHSFSPGELGQALNENNVYNGQDSIVRRELEQTLPYARVRLDCGTVSESIDRLLEEKMYPIVKVRQKSGAVHRIMLTGMEKDTHDIAAMDPVDGSAHVNDYGNRIYGVRVVTGSMETLETNGACLQA